MNETVRFFVGIDPGLSGAYGVLDGTKGVLCRDLPLLTDGSRKRIDVRTLLSELSPLAKENTLVILEKSQPMPRDGAMGSFRYGEVYGELYATLIFLKIPFMEVHPATWRTKIVGKGKGKDESRRLAMDLFPELATNLLRKKDHGRAEALLLAWYARTTVRVEG